MASNEDDDDQNHHGSENNEEVPEHEDKQPRPGRPLPHTVAKGKRPKMTGETIVEMTIVNETIVEVTVENAIIVEMIIATIVMTPGIVMKNLGHKPATKEDHVASSGQRSNKMTMINGTKKMSIKTR